MQLKFKRIVIENFLSLGSADVVLSDRGYCHVVGVNNNPSDSAKSNGSGKSSLFEAVAWALTGETIRGVKDVVNMYNPGGTKVELEFTVDNDEYVVARYKEHKQFKTDLKIIVNGQDKSGKGIRDSQKLLESYLPDLTSSLVGSVILLGQGLPQRFTNNTPLGRKEVLEKLSKSDFMIEDLKQRLQTRKTVLSSQLREVEDNTLSAQSKIQTLSNQIVQLESQLSTMEDPQIYDDLITRAQDKILQLETESNEVTQRASSLRVLLEGLNKQKLEVVNTFKLHENSVRDEYMRSRGELSSRETSLRARITQLETEIRKAKSIKDTCPTCGKKFDNVFIPDTTQQELEIEQLRKSLSSIVSEITNLTNNYNSKLSEINTQLTAETSGVSSEISDVTSQSSLCERELTQLRSNINKEQSELQKYLQYKSTYDATVSTINNTIDSNKVEIEKLNSNLVYYIDSKDKVQSKLEVVNKFITIANRDFRGYLLKNVIEFIDRKAKEYCQYIFGTETIDFILDGNNIDIKYCSKQYETLSGGEKQKVDLIVQFAIRDMLCQFLDFRSNILALDEIFDNLDSVGCDKVIDLISNKLTDIDSIFIITHHQDLAIPSDSIITVTKHNNGVSTVQ